MLASVSPASCRAMIEGQSFWGIFPLLLDLSIWDLRLSILGSDFRSPGSEYSPPAIARRRLSRPVATARNKSNPRPGHATGSTNGSAAAPPLRELLHNTAQPKNSEAFNLVRATLKAQRPRHSSPITRNYTRTILPGLRMLSGSSALLMVRITESASPCSATRKSILP